MHHACGGCNAAGLHRSSGFGVATLALASALIFLSGAGVRAQVVLDPDRLNTGATTPEKSNCRNPARRRCTACARHGGRALRAYAIAWAKDDAEFNNLARNAVVLTTVITQTEAELPLRRAYLATPDGAKTPLRRLNSWRSAINSETLAYQPLGEFREDGFYLIPGPPARRTGEVQLDFAVNRVGFVLIHLPEAEQNLGYELHDPSSGAQPNQTASRDMIKREFPGFPLPKF
jgi:hypothetical protein